MQTERSVITYWHLTRTILFTKTEREREWRALPESRDECAWFEFWLVCHTHIPGLRFNSIAITWPHSNIPRIFTKGARNPATHMITSQTFCFKCLFLTLSNIFKLQLKVIRNEMFLAAHIVQLLLQHFCCLTHRPVVAPAQLRNSNTLCLTSNTQIQNTPSLSQAHRESHSFTLVNMWLSQIRSDESARASVEPFSYKPICPNHLFTDRTAQMRENSGVFAT